MAEEKAENGVQAVIDPIQPSADAQAEVTEVNEDTVQEDYNDLQTAGDDFDAINSALDELEG